MKKAFLIDWEGIEENIGGFDYIKEKNSYMVKQNNNKKTKVKDKMGKNIATHITKIVSLIHQEFLLVNNLDKGPNRNGQ